MLAIETRGVKKTYVGAFGRRRREALHCVDLAVPRGTVFGLIGLNGAGKTTFIKTLLSVVRQDEGKILVLGGSPEDPDIRRRIGYLPERLALPRALTARGFLFSVGRIKGIRDYREQAEERLHRLGLSKEADTRIGGFSKGMRQRLGLAAALLGAPELLILDEPTDGIDPLGRIDIRRILEQERDRGTTVFINSHLLTETERLATDVGIISKGRIVKTGNLETLTGKENRWRIRVVNEGAEQTMTDAKFTPSERTGEWLIEAETPDILNQAVETAIANGALIDRLIPDVRSLEEVLEAVEGNGGR